MRFVPIKELRSSTSAMRRDLAAKDEIVVTANGRPITLLTPVDSGNLEQELLASRRARARAALDRARAQAAAAGTCAMPMGKVEQVVAAARKGRRSAR